MKFTNQIKILLFISCVFLQGCSENPSIHKAFKVGVPDQKFRETLTVQKKFYYRISLIFNWQSNELQKALEQEKIIGRSEANREGVALPLHVIITKGNEVFLDEVFVTFGSESLSGFCLNELSGKEEPRRSFLVDLLTDDYCTDNPNLRYIWGPNRRIMGTDLPPGYYVIEIKTLNLEGAAALSEMESFIEIVPYSPKI